MSQTSVSEFRDTYIQGAIQNPNEAVTESRIVDDSTNILPGYPVVQGTNDLDVSLPSAAFTQAEFQGIAVYSDTAKEHAISTGVNSYADDEPITILKDGVIAVLVEDTVTKGEIVFAVHTTGGASTLYTYRGDLDTDKAAEIPATFEESGVSGDLVKIRLSSGAGLGSRLT